MAVPLPHPPFHPPQHSSSHPPSHPSSHPPSRHIHQVEAMGLDCLNPGQFIGNLSLVRRFELAAAINRLRTARMNRWNVLARDLGRWSLASSLQRYKCCHCLISCSIFCIPFSPQTKFSRPCALLDSHFMLPFTSADALSYQHERFIKALAWG